MRPLPVYLPGDQNKHLGDPPWKQSDVLDAWIAAHNHDPRTKCYVEYGCQAIDDHYEWLLEAHERRRHGDVITDLRSDLTDVLPPKRDVPQAIDREWNRTSERDVARVDHVALAIAREWNRTPDGDVGIDLAQAALDAADEWDYP